MIYFHLIIVTTFTLNETIFFINNIFNFSKRRQLLTQGKLLDGQDKKEGQYGLIWCSYFSDNENMQHGQLPTTDLLNPSGKFHLSPKGTPSLKNRFQHTSIQIHVHVLIKHQLWYKLLTVQCMQMSQLFYHPLVKIYK